MTTDTSSDRELYHWTNKLRSTVRPVVTYIVILVYTLVTAFAIVWLLLEGQTDNALALLAGLSGVATGIVGFWFGTRGKGGLKPDISNESPETLNAPVPPAGETAPGGGTPQTNPAGQSKDANTSG